MSHAHSIAHQIHSRALEVSSRYRKAEAELIDILQQVESHRVHLVKGYSSVFQYVTDELGLSESVAYNLITVARKAREVPALKAEIQTGSITLSNARKIAPVLTRENQSEWLGKAGQLSHRELEREVAKVRPEEATRERITYVSGGRVRLETGLSEADLACVKRVQDLMSQKLSRAVSLEETIAAMAREYLDRHDPVEKAKRARPVTKPVALQAEGRNPIPAAVLHQVNLRDRRTCSFIRSDGERCGQARWVEIHHKIPVHAGGKNEVENLITLCSTHHKWLHRIKH